MKNFTLLITSLFIALTVTGQKVESLQLKIEKLQEKFASLSEHSKIFQNQPAKAYSFAGLKSTAATEKLDSTVTRMLNLNTDVWENDWKEDFFYDAQMRSTLWNDYEWNFDDDNWEKYGKTELEYNTQGHIGSMTFSYIDENSGVMTTEDKIEATYNANGSLNKVSNYSFETGSWVLAATQEYHYNASGKIIQVDMISVDEEDESAMKYTFSYNASGKPEAQRMYFIDEGEEMLFYQTLFSYDGSGRRIESEDWGISFITFQIEKESRTVYEYNATGDVSVEIYSEWNGSEWEETDKDEYIYSNTNFSEVAFPSYIEMYFMGDDFYLSFNKVMTKINTSSMIDESWKLTETTTYYYSSEPSSNIDELKESTVSVFPNPAIDNVTFSWTENHEQLQLEVYLLNGAKVMEQPAYQGKAISVSHLERGVYFYELLNEQKIVFSGKLVKQ
jgi:hypothetical protein